MDRTSCDASSPSALIQLMGSFLRRAQRCCGLPQVIQQFRTVRVVAKYLHREFGFYSLTWDLADTRFPTGAGQVEQPQPGLVVTAADELRNVGVRPACGALSRPST